MAKILLIDDSTFILSSTRTFLEGEGHEVVGAAKNGQLGIELYKEKNPDLVLLDLTMPTMNGGDCLDAILTFDGKANVLVVSALRDKATLQGHLDRGAKDVVHKPLRFRDESFNEEFRTKISAALAA